jgi:hypothetical protein
MKYNIASGKRFLNRSRIAQIANHSIDAPISAQAIKIAQIAGRPHQQPQMCSLFRQNARNMTAEKSRSAGNKGEHSVFDSTESDLF